MPSSHQGPVEDMPQGPRERVLNAALKLFVEQGYFNTNIPDISRESKCSIGSIYHHFLNKEEIASELYKLGIRHFRAALNDSVDQNANLETQVRSIVLAFLQFAETHLLWSHYLWLARHDEFLNTGVARPTSIGFDHLGRTITKAIKNGIRKGEIAKINAEVFWSILFGIPLSFMRDWLDGYTKNSPTEVAPIIADACWAALKGVPNS
ncbi:MAG: TetR/AcrR family transcriptional regulator [Deltaproteobacteria bacterium]|nr:TetR/AcrR family transcriptional regulator [Deltaproteobacteria bacterium]